MQQELDTYTVNPDHKVINMNSELFHLGLNTPLAEVPCTCKGSETVAAKKILHTGANTKEIVVYNNCARTLYAAMLRQMRAIPGNVDPETLTRYHQHCDYLFDKYWLPKLLNFDYNVEQWFNHLATRSKQLEVLPFINGTITDERELRKTNYTLFCKRERQIIDGKMPKNRAISACPPSMKFVMGPIIWALEELASTIPSYKINDGKKSYKNWSQIEDRYKQLYDSGFQHTVDIDGSAWDTCMAEHMKYLPFKIYTWLVDNNKIKHVNPEIFLEVATKQYRTLEAKIYLHGKSQTIMKTILKDTMFSGSPDTTFANTTVMGSVLSFTMQESGYDEDQRELQAAGDDSTMFLQMIKADLEANIRRVWSGLKLIPKYVLIGTFEDITFCSTHVIPYHLNGEHYFKIIRQLDRMSPLSHWSESALAYSKSQMKTYYKDLHTSLTNWASGLPYFENYVLAMKIQHDLIPGGYAPTIVGKPKLHLTEPVTGRIKIDPNILRYMHYGHDFAYGFDMRQSNNTPPKQFVYDWLLKKYELTKSDIDEHSRDINRPFIYDPVSKMVDPPRTGLDQHNYS